jgi:hypothetical protein
VSSPWLTFETVTVQFPSWSSQKRPRLARSSAWCSSQGEGQPFDTGIGALPVPNKSDRLELTCNYVNSVLIHSEHFKVSWLFLFI